MSKQYKQPDEWVTSSINSLMSGCGSRKGAQRKTSGDQHRQLASCHRRPAVVLCRARMLAAALQGRLAAALQGRLSPHFRWPPQALAGLAAGLAAEKSTRRA
jgi:hypothetical protein